MLKKMFAAGAAIMLLTSVAIANGHRDGKRVTVFNDPAACQLSVSDVKDNLIKSGFMYFTTTDPASVARVADWLSEHHPDKFDKSDIVEIDWIEGGQLPQGVISFAVVDASGCILDAIDIQQDAFVKLLNG